MPSAAPLVTALTTAVLLSTAVARAPSAPSLYIAANFHDNEATIPGFARQVGRLASHFGPTNMHVTVYESDSTDATPALLDTARRQFQDLGITHNITTNGALVRGRRSRIDFLADTRNELLKPLRAMAPERVFDYVVFLNDIYFVAEDVLKLLAVGGDVACGTDFIPIGEANKIYRPAVDDEFPIFYDAWVARSLDGLPLRAMPPYVPPPAVVPTLKRLASMNLAFPDYTRLANSLALQVTPQPEIVQLQCCWNGIVVTRAAPFYAGLSFRSNLPHECASSECSHFCADMWALNYTRFAMHHGVRVAYDEDTWTRAKALDVPYEATQLPFLFVDVRPPTVLCCGEHIIVRQPTYERQPCEQTDAFLYRVWMALTEAPISEELLEFLVPFVDNAPALSTDMLRVLLSDEPRAPCVMQSPVSLVDRACLADSQRTIPRTLIQAGVADAREALVPQVSTWKTLHPDHEYEFVDVDADRWHGVPHAVVETFHAVRGAGHAGLAADIARYALLYYRGGIVADLDTLVDESLSCSLANDDTLVQVTGGDTGAAHGRRPIAVAAIANHPAVLIRLTAALKRASIIDDVAATWPTSRHITVQALRLDVDVFHSGQGARIKHRLDPTIAV